MGAAVDVGTLTMGVVQPLHVPSQGTSMQLDVFGCIVTPPYPPNLTLVYNPLVGGAWVGALVG